MEDNFFFLLPSFLKLGTFLLKANNEKSFCYFHNSDSNQINFHPGSSKTLWEMYWLLMLITEILGNW